MPPVTRLELAEIVRLYGADFCAAHPVSFQQRGVLQAIRDCRTAALGAHVLMCTVCEYRHPIYNPCRNRHCPKCQCTAANLWIEKRSTRLLNTHYFHVVFTLPAELRALAKHAPAIVYSLLMTCAAKTLQELGHDRLGATLGITEVLHTWTRQLNYHPHVHCIVTAGGLSDKEDKWIAVKDENFLFPEGVVGALFRGKMLAALNAAYDEGEFSGFDAFEDPQGFDLLMQSLPRKRWHVYLKPVFRGVKSVLNYLGRYTHRVGISNGRLISLINGQVTFKTKHGRTETLDAVEFLHRFVQHVLPRRFVKIRHYGILASQNVNSKFAAAAKLLPTVTTTAETPDSQPDTGECAVKKDDLAKKPCPLCGGKIYVLVVGVPRRRVRTRKLRKRKPPKRRARKPPKPRTRGPP